MYRLNKWLLGCCYDTAGKQGWVSAQASLPAQLHSLAFSSFASLVAPFGGFFASGLKRAFNLKVAASSTALC